MNLRLLLSSLFGVATFRKSHCHISFAFVDQGLASGLNFFTLVALARLLGPGEFGAYSIAWSIVMLSKPVQGALVIGPLQSLGAKVTAEARPSYLRAVRLQQAGIAVLLGAAAVVGAWLYGLVTGIALASLLPALFFLVLGDQFHDYFRRFFFVVGRGQRACLLDLLVAASRVVFLSLAFNLARPPDAAIMLYAVAASTLVVVPLAILASGALHAGDAAFVKTLRRHWTFGKWLLPYSLGTAVIGTSIPLVAASAFDVELAGGIRATFNVVAPGSVIVLALFSVVPISASRVLESAGRVALRGYLEKIAAATTLAALAIGLTASVYARELLTFFYGEDYAHFAEIVRWHSVSLVILGLQVPIESGIRALEKTYVLTNAVFIQAVVVGLILLLLPGHLGERAIMLALVVDRLAPMTYLALWLWRELQGGKMAAARP